MTRGAVRALLHRDRPWAVYALCDLDPDSFPHCTWWQTGPSLALLYRAFSPPIFWADGPVALPFHEPNLALQIREDSLPPIRARYPHLQLKNMLRMALHGDPQAFDAHPLTPAHLPALLRLYDAPDGPDFFHPAMLASGAFFGAWHGDLLIAAAGTHVLSHAESAAAIGNVYTHPAHRGQGHAARLTAAVASHLRRTGVQTIALSVAAANHSAITVYSRLGFRPHCSFYEGFASTART